MVRYYRVKDNFVRNILPRRLDIVNKNAHQIYQDF